MDEYVGEELRKLYEEIIYEKYRFYRRGKTKEERLRNLANEQEAKREETAKQKEEEFQEALINNEPWAIERKQFFK